MVVVASHHRCASVHPAEQQQTAPATAAPRCTRAQSPRTLGRRTGRRRPTASASPPPARQAAAARRRAWPSSRRAATALAAGNEAGARRPKRRWRGVEGGCGNALFVHHDPVVVLATGVTTATRVVAVLANTAMASTDVPALLPVFVDLFLLSRHSYLSRSHSYSVD